MTLRVRCLHGHSFYVPVDAQDDAVCPLCGSVIRPQSKVNTKERGSLDDTADLPGQDSSVVDTLVPSKTLSSDADVAGESGTRELRSASEVSDAGGEETQQLAATGDRVPSDNSTGSEASDGFATSKTATFEKTVHLDGPLPAPREDDSEGGRTVTFGKTIVIDDSNRNERLNDNEGRTVDLGKTLNIDEPSSNSGDSGDDGAQTLVLGQTLDIDKPPSTGSSDRSSPSNKGESGDDGIAPTAMLPTLAAQSPPPQRLRPATPQADSANGSQSPSTPKSAPGKQREIKPPELPGYSVLEELGRGGMGIVYRARHEKLKREVALKTLLRINPVELHRFKQEFRSLANIAHPNLAGLYDLLSDGETWCFSMEILEAVDFNEYVWSEFEALRRDSRRPLTAQLRNGSPRLTPEVQERLFEGLRQLCLGLDALHQKGMLHRDIKPSNVLVTTEGRVVLVDFGLASEFEEGSEERLRAIQGTPEYMAPEQAACNPISPATDWYAVGVMIYEVLTGRWPIQGQAWNIILRKQKEAPPEAREFEPSLPHELNDLCMRLLARKPSDRPTVEDVLRCVGAEGLIETQRTTILAGAGKTDLVGREAHLDGLQKSFKQVIAGTTKTIFVHGKSGMGKSVLIQKFLDGVREQQQAVVLSGRCYEQESVPFKALDSLIDSLAAHVARLPSDEAIALAPEDFQPLVRLFPVLGQIPGADADGPSIENVDQQELRQRAMNALREMLKQLSERQPLVLYVDDLQWGDEDSANLLADLVRPPGSPRVLVLGSYRTENRDTSVCLKALHAAYTTGQHHPHLEEIAVDSLQEADAERLALMLLGRNDALTRDLAGKIARESRGWPFFVWELAQHVHDDPDIGDRSLELDEVIWNRVARLPEETRRLLELVAVTGRPLPAADAYQAIGAIDKGQGFLGQLRAQNFIRTTESNDETIVETYHDRIRESVVDHLEESTIRSHCLNLATAIESVHGIKARDLRAHIRSTPDFEEPQQPYSMEKAKWQRIFDLAYFFDNAAQPGRAFPFALAAAEQASKQNALEVAEQQYRIALRGCAREPVAIRFRVAEGMGDVLMLRGRYDEADSQFQTAHAMAEGRAATARIEGKLGTLDFKKGDMENAAAHLESALAQLGTRPPTTAVAQIVCLLKELSVQLLHTTFPKWFVGVHSADSENAKMNLFRVRLYDRMSYAYWYTRGIVPTLWSHLRQLNLSERYPPSPELAQACSFHSIIMTGIPYPSRGIAYSEKSFKIRHQLGDLWGQGQTRSFQTFSCIVGEQFDRGRECSEQAVDLLEKAGDVWEANMARMMCAWSLYFLGDLKGVLRLAKKAYQIGQESGDRSGMAIALGFWVRITDAPEGAIQAEVDRPREDPITAAVAIQSRGLELLLRQDSPVEAAQVFQDSLDLAKSRNIRNPLVFSGASFKATALRLAAERAAQGQQRQRAIRAARKAVRAALRVTTGYRNCRAQALREAGLLAALEGKAGRARQYLDESIEVAQRQNARYHHAQSVLARGQVGSKFGWEGAEEQLAEGHRELKELEEFDED